MSFRCNDTQCQNGIFKKNITESDCANEFNFLYHLVASEPKRDSISAVKDIYAKTPEIRVNI